MLTGKRSRRIKKWTHRTSSKMAISDGGGGISREGRSVLPGREKKGQLGAGYTLARHIRRGLGVFVWGKRLAAALVNPTRLIPSGPYRRNLGEG